MLIITEENNCVCMWKYASENNNIWKEMQMMQVVTDLKDGGGGLKRERQGRL